MSSTGAGVVLEKANARPIACWACGGRTTFMSIRSGPSLTMIVCSLGALGAAGSAGRAEENDHSSSSLLTAAGAGAPGFGVDGFDAENCAADSAANTSFEGVDDF